MKKILIFFTLGISIFQVKAQQNEMKASELYEASYALLIGNADYQTEWPKLPGVHKDLSIVKEALELHGFQVNMGLNYTKTQMDSAFSMFISKYGNVPDNRLLFYYAGHGETVRTSYGESLSYLVPIDAPGSSKDVGNFQGKSMEMTQIEIYAKRLQSKHALFLFDACFAGSIFGQSRALDEALTYQLNQPVRQFITSGDADETVPDLSIFRQELVAALKSPVADVNKDGFLTGSELGTFLQNSVVEKSNGRQHPQYGKIRNPSLDKGDFFFLIDPNVKRLTSRSAINPKIGEIAAIERHGQIEVKSDLSGSLLLNGKEIGQTGSGVPVRLADLPAGKYELEFKGTENWRGSVNVTPGKTSTVEITPYINKARRNLFIPMTYVEGGKFEMGDEKGQPDQKPVHTVRLRDFEIGTYEVTVGQFQQFVEQTGYVTELEQMSGTHLVLDRNKGLIRKEGMNWRFGPNGQEVKSLDQPVVFVSWNDAMSFTKWMTATYEGTYRLPTEAEWEFAAQGGIRQRQSVEDTTQTNELSKFQRLLRVGDQNGKPNIIGIYHTDESVSEWCLDWYDKNYYRQSSNLSPMGPNRGEMKVIRGNSWLNEEKEGKLTDRKKTYPHLCSFSDGFRVVRVLED